MAWTFNPFSGTFDQKGSGGGGGASYIDGEVATYADLPLDGSATLNSAWLVRTASGVWPVTRKQAGIYIRTATGGSSRDADYTYAGTMPDVFSDAQFLLYDNTDTSKNLAFDLGGITTGTTRALTVPNASGTIVLGNDTRIVNILKSGTTAGAYSGGAGGTIDLSGGNADATYGAGGAAGSINLSGGDALDDDGEGHAGLAGGSIDLSAGVGGAGGSITLRGSQDADGANASGAAGSIDLSGGSSAGAGGSIISTGGQNSGGTLNMSAVGSDSGGSINTSGGGSINTSGGGPINTSNNGGAINTSNNGGAINTFGTNESIGGSIDTSDGGGSINLRGTGSVGFGINGTRTTVVGTATADRSISLPDASGVLALEYEVRFDASGSYTYTGQAAAGSLEAAAVWFIRRSEFSSTGSYVSTATANNVEWDDRLTATYT